MTRRGAVQSLGERVQAHDGCERGHRGEDTATRKRIQDRDVTRSRLDALPGRLPSDSVSPIGRDLVRSSSKGRKFVLADDWLARVEATSHVDCRSRDACLEEVSVHRWAGLDCRRCPHWGAL